MAARLEAPPPGVRPVTVTAPARRAGLAWPRLSVAAELATIGAGYAGYALVRLAIHADRQAAFAHAAQLWQAERRLHLRIEPWLNHLAAAQPSPHPAGARNQETLMAQTDPWSGEDDDTDYDYYDTPSGNPWRPGPGPGQPPAASPGGRAAGPRRLSPSLTFRTRHHRPGRGSAGPDKETP